MMVYPAGQAARPYMIETYSRGREVLSYAAGEAYDPARHYVIVAEKGREAAPVLAEMGFRPFEDYYDQSDMYMWGLPVDWKYMGASIGRGSFYNSQDFSFAAAVFFEKVGRCTSINETAYFHHDHPLNLIGTGRFQQFFSPENQAKYYARVKEDPHVTNRGEKLIIGSDVWIGANAFINVSRCRVIGDGAIVAAGAVVNSDVPPYAVVGGAPARVLKYRYSPSEIETLLRVRWWDWDRETMDKYAEELLDPKRFFATFG